MTLYGGTLKSWLAQSRIAEERLTQMIRDAQARGFVEEIPGIWILRNEAGEAIETIEL